MASPAARSSRRQAANHYPGAARTDPMRASDVAVPAAPAQPAGRGTRRSRSQSVGGLSAAEQRAVGVGDQIMWDTAPLPCGGDAAMATITAGTVEGVYDGGVLVTRPRGDENERYGPYQIPTEAISELLTPAALETSPAEAAVKRQRATEASGPSPQPAAAAQSARPESAVTRGLREQIRGLEGEIDRLKVARAKAVQSKHSATSYRRTALHRKAGSSKKKTEALQARLRDSELALQRITERLESHTPLAGQEVHVKSDERGNPVPENLRDLITDLRTKDGIAGEKVFEVVQDTLEAFGAEIADPVKPSSALELSNHCLVESATILADDQARRMAEELRDGPQREIRREAWTKEEAAAAASTEASGIASHKAAVLDPVSGWLHDKRYKPADLPKHVRSAPRIGASDTATTDEEFEAAACAVLFSGVDGTKHARCAPSLLPSGPLALLRLRFAR